jgi:hypothetical protein
MRGLGIHQSAWRGFVNTESVLIEFFTGLSMLRKRLLFTTLFGAEANTKNCIEVDYAQSQIITGFDGYICLPTPMAIELGLELCGYQMIERAGIRGDEH